MQGDLDWIIQNSNLLIILTAEAFDGNFVPFPEQQSWYVTTAVNDKTNRVIGVVYFAYTDQLRNVAGARESWLGARAFPDVTNYHKGVFNTFFKK